MRYRKLGFSDLEVSATKVRGQMSGGDPADQGLSAGQIATQMWT
jgi:hypothetical protein